jgi:YbbR domain-containing protein
LSTLARLWQTLLNILSSFGLSLFLAVIIWVVAVNTNNPLVVQRDFPGTGIAVKPENARQGLVVVSVEPPRVLLDIRAPRESWERLEPSDLRVWADLKGLPTGTHQVEVQVDQVPPVDSTVRILRRNPDRVTVVLDETVTRTVPVKVDILDRSSVPSSYQILTPTTSPAEIAVFGPKAVLEDIDRAEVTVELRGSRATVEAERVVRLMSTAGDVIDPSNVVAMRLGTRLVQVNVPIQQRQGYRELIVNPVILGEPARGFWMSNRRVEPNTISVVGLPSVIEQLPSIVRTEPIDISGERAGTITRSARLDLPEDVSPVSQRVVSVTVEIEPQISGKTITMSPEPNGLSPGLAVTTIAPPNVDVLVEGPQVELESLTEADLVATLDLTGLGIGTHLVAPSIHAPGSLDVQGVSPEQVEIAIGEARGERVLSDTVAVAGLDSRLRALTKPLVITMSLAGPVLSLGALSPAVLTPTVDVSGRGVGTYILSPTVALPPGITLSRVEPAQVTVDLFAPDNTLAVTQTLTWDNLGSGLVLNLQPREISILARGPGRADTLRADAALRAVLDLKGLEAGTYMLQPQVLLPPGYELISILPKAVEARLSRGTR